MPSRHWSDGPRRWYPWALLLGRGMYVQPSPSFEKWAAAVTPAQIHELLTERFIYDEPPALHTTSVSCKELAYFDSTVSSFVGSNSGPLKHDTRIATSDAVGHLKKAIPESSTLITSAEKALERLLITHAFFPFATADSSTLTRSSLLRAVILLTSNSDRELGEKPAPRTQSQRIEFIFASLVCTLPRTGSAKDILDIVCRIPYPRKFHRVSERYHPRQLDDLVPVAKRLSEEQTTPVWQTKDQYLQVSELQPLADLVAALTKQPASRFLSNKERLDSEDFEAWAIEARLMPALDKLFGYFLESRERRDRIEAYQKSEGIVVENRKAKEPMEQPEIKSEKDA